MDLTGEDFIEAIDVSRVDAVWRYAKESVRRKVLARDLSDDLVGKTLMEQDSIMAGREDRLIAQRLSFKPGFGKLLIRVVYEEFRGERLWLLPTGRGPIDTLGGDRSEGRVR